MKVFLKFVIVVVVCFVIFFFIFHVPKSHSSLLDKPAVTVINPLRGAQLGLEKADLLASLKGQWKATNDATISATWLWQYSALEDARLTSFAKSEMKDQEFGIFLEIDRNFAAKSDVVYRGQGPWYFSDGLFLISYDQAERKKLIDTVFAKFKKTFGYYPKSVGGWWVGAASLDYIHKNYGVIASLQVADQFDLDVYSVWGQPWSIPYLSVKQNAAIPAPSFEKSSGVVIMQWAARDPTYGYGNSSESTYSMQDYFLQKYDLSYIDYLFGIFLKKPGDQLVIGLEGGFPPKVYQSDYKEKLLKIKNLQSQQKITIETAGNFAEKFLARKQAFGGTQYFLSKGFTSDGQSFWYNSSHFRAGIQKKGENIFLVDLRNYSNAPNEDFAILPNSQGYLRISSPSIIDSARDPSQKILLGKSKNELKIKKENEKIILTDGTREYATFTKDIVTTSDKQFNFSSNKQTDKETFLFSKKELFLFPLVGWLPFSIITNLILLQIMPFLFFVCIQTFFITKKKFYSFVFALFLFTLFYAHIPSIIVTEFITRKKVALAGGLGVYIFVFLGLLAFFYFKERRFIKKILVVGLFGLLLVGSTLLFSWQKFILTPFEIKSLQTIQRLEKDVYYVMPKVMPVYRAVKPLLFEDYHYGEFVTGSHWQEVRRPEGKFLTFENLDKKIIFVSRYLGAELYPEEIEKYKLRKVFDSAQIAIFSQ